MTAYYSLCSSIGLKRVKTILLIFVMMFGKLLDAGAQSASPYCDFQVLSFLGTFGYDNASGNNFWITGLTTSGAGVVTPNNFSGGTSNAAMPSAGFDQGVYLSFGPTVTQTQAPTFTITRPAGTYACIFHVLVDWNNDNDLVDAGEEIITSGTIAAATSTFTTSAYTIPITAPTGGNNTVGSHRLRIICEYQGETQRVPCGATGSSGAQGNAKDFTLTVIAATACSGNPPQLTVSPASTAVCSATSTTLNLTGIAASGYTFQWQQSQTSGGPYTNATGASTNSSYSTPTTLPFNPTYYVCQVTCSNSGLTTQSTESTVSLNSFLSCYCIGSYASANAGTRGITQVILNGTPIINNPSTVNNVSPYYTSYTAASPISNAGLAVNTAYTLSVKVGTQTNSLNNVGAWIDYNQDGVFSAAEFLGSFSNTAPSTTTNINFTVPGTSLSGITGMRVRHRYGASVLSTDACTNYTGAAGAGGAGETEDYRVNISSCLAPTVQASGNSMGSINTTDATINWTGNGNGDAVLVVLNQGSAPAGPAQATAYAANSDFTLAPLVSGTTRAIYAGTGNSVNVTGLITNTTYFYSIYTYLTGTNCYNVVSPASGSFTTANSPMTTTTQVVTHPTLTSISPGSTNNQLLQLRIDCSTGTAPALVVSQLSFNTNALNGGTTNPADIANAKIFYTGTSSAFSSTTQFGSTVVNPNGSFTVNGSTTLVPGSNYFWLTYDIVAAPTISDFVDARLTSINVGSILTPSGDPAGNRQIVLVYCTPLFGYCACSSCSQSSPFNTTAISFGTLNVSGLTCQSASWLLLPNTGSVQAGQSYPLSISRAQAGYAVSAIIYVDWNHNGILNDPGELILNQSYGSSTTINVPSVTVPIAALTGLTRMRVISLYDPAVVDPCNPTSSFLVQGEARDFDITVIGSCIAPIINACPSNIVKCDTAIVTWTNPTASGTNPTVVCSPASGSTFPIGTTLVTCTATNSCGTSSCSFNVTIGQSPVVNASSNAPFCEGTVPLQLSSTSLTATSWSWTGPGGYTSLAEDPVRTPSDANMTGSYKVVVTDGNGCKDSTVIPVTIYELPNIVITPSNLPAHVCTGSTISLLAENLGPGGFDIGGATYVWSTTETANAIVIGGSGIYSVTGTDVNGCINADDVTVTESAPPAAPIIVAQGDVNLCSNDNGGTWSTVVLHTTNYSNNLFWNTGIDFTQDIIAAFPYGFNVIYTDGFGCTSESNTITTIGNLTSVAPVNSQVSSNAPGNITCAVPVTLTLAAQSLNPLGDGYLGDNAQWKWYLDGSSCGAGILVGTGASITVTPPSTPGPHTYSVRAEGLCNTTNCASIVITVKDPSIAPAFATASLPVICEGDQTVLSVSGGQLGTGASWKLYEGACGVGAPIQSSSSPSFIVIPQSPGLHTYYIRAEGDCNNTLCAMINVDVKDSSAQATSLSSSSSAICEGDAVTMNLSGGHLGTGAVWSWYEGGCGVGATLQSGPSTSFTITPQSSGLHTYSVRAEGDCNATLCRSVSVMVNESPVIGACPSNMTQCDNHIASWTNPTASGSPVATVNCVPASGSTFATGTTTVTCTASNLCGTSSCSFTVTINESPVIGSCPSNIAQCNNHVATWTNPTSSGSPAATVICVPTSGSNFITGTTTVTCTASNSCGTSSCAFTVTINESPVIGGCPSNITQCDNHVATWTNPTSSGSPAATVTCVPASGSTFATGTTTVTCTASNSCGTSSCSFTVTINESPVIGACPSNISQCDNHVATWTNPTSSGSPAATVTCVPASGSNFITGTTTVTCTASNSCGTSSCAFTVTINESPVIGACPSNITQCDNHVASWTNPTSSGSPAATVTCVPASGSTFATGTTNVTCTSSNLCGTSSCSFTVTINESPVIGACPSNITQCDNHVATWTNPTSSGSPAATVTCVPASGSNFITGTTTVTCTASNSCSTSSCAFTVTINESPVIGACPSNITQCDNHVANWTNPTSSGSPAASVTCVPASGSTFATGITTVTCTASNLCGTSSCSFTVTINESPVIGSCPSNIAQCNNHVATWTTPTSSGSPAATVTCVPPSGSTFATGTTTVTCTASNSCGTSSCSFTVTINESPVIGACPSNITQCDNHVATWANPTSSGSPAATVTCVPASGSTFATGATTVTCTASNLCGTSSCSFTVVIRESPVIGTCPTDITQCDNHIANWTTPTSSGSPAATVACVPASGSTFPTGTTAVTCTASNVCGTSSCSFNVTVNTSSTAPSSASSSSSQVCLGSNVSLNVSGGFLGTGANWIWYEGNCGTGGVIGTGASVTITPSSTGLHTYYVRAEGTCNNTTCVSTSVTVNTVSTDPTSATSNAPVNGICLGGNVTLNVAGGTLGNGAVYKWYEDGCGNGASIGTGPSITITPAIEGLHSYYVRAEGPCNTTNCVGVQVLVGTYSVEASGINSSIVGNSICTGNNITLTVNGGFLGTVAQWKWYSGSCGGTAAGSGPSITVNPSVATNYFVRAEGSCNNTLCKSIAVNVSSTAPSNPPPTITSAPNGICSGNGSTVICQAVAGATFYSWSAPNGTTFDGGNPSPYITTANTVQVNFGNLPNGVTGYDICVFAGNGCGNTVTKCRYIRGRVQTAQTITGNASSCPNTTSAYSITSLPGADSYTWTITGAATINGGSSTLTTTATTVNVNFLSGWTSGTLTVYGSMSCGYNGPAKTITIISTPVVPGIISGPPMVCPNGTYTYSIAPVAGATAYNWSTNVPGAVIGAGTTTRSITFPASIPAGSTVSVTATGSCGTSAPQVKSIATGLANAPGNIIGQAFGQCGQTGVSYSILPVAGATSYLWSASNGASINGLNNITTANVDFPANFTTSTVSVVAINGCGNSVPQTKVIAGAPASPGPITGQGAVCVGIQAYTYTVGGSTGATAYVWSNPPGSIILNGQNTNSVSILYTDNSGGTVSVYASNACGQSASSTFAVSVTCREAQISEGSLIDATLYPNPTIGTTTLRFETITAGDYKVSVVDITGQTMQTSTLTAVEGVNMHELDLSKYAKGLYMVRLEREGEAMQMLRITVE